MKKNTLLAVVVGLFLLVFAVVVVVSGNHVKSGIVNIQGLAQCSKDIHNNVKDDIETKTYSLVKSANDYNKLKTSDGYKATIRGGSCKQEQTNQSTDSSGVHHTVNTSSIVIDIQSAKQSWKITYDWVTQSGSLANIDLGTIKPECLPVDQLKYGDFKCENIMSLAKYGTDKSDPILPYMPYDGAGFRLEYNPDNKTVSVIILPPSGTQDVAAFTENTKAIIPYWFKKRGLDESKYRVLYSSDIDDGANNDGSDSL